MNLFLEGERGIGKSYLIRQALKPYEKQTAGYSVQRLYLGDQIAGFRVITLTGEFPPLDEKYNENLSGIFISAKGKCSQPIENAIKKVAENLTNQHFILLDEVGGIEVVSESYMQTLEHLLNKDILVIGVIKSRLNLENTLRETKNSSEYFEKYNHLRSLIESKGNIIELTESNLESVKNQVQLFVKQAGRSSFEQD